MSSLEELNYRIGVNANTVENCRREINDIWHSGAIHNIWSLVNGPLTPRHFEYHKIESAYDKAITRENYLKKLMIDTTNEQINLVQGRQVLVLARLNELISDFKKLIAKSPRSLQEDVIAHNAILDIITFLNSILPPMLAFKNEIKFLNNSFEIDSLLGNEYREDDVELFNLYCKAKDVEKDSINEINSLFNYRVHETILRNKIRIKKKRGIN